jgi:peptide/nickel transport system substrate-binding protein
MTKRILSLLIVAAMLLLTACAAPAAPAPAPAAEGEATEAPAEEGAEAAAPAAAEGEQILIGGFDVGPGGAPQAVLYMSGAGHNWYSKMFTPIVMMNADFTEFVPEGGLAVSWEPNEDATVWTFNLREGVTWHDGEPFTAQDLKFTAEFVHHPDSPSTFPPFFFSGDIIGLEEYIAGEADEIAGVVAVDDNTLEIQLSQPRPRLFAELRWFYALPEHAIDFAPSELDTTDWWWSRPIGTGPFQFGSYEKDQFMELVPNEAYWDGAPKLDRLVNRYFADETAAVLALSSGDIDFTYVSADIVPQFQGDPAFQVFEGPSFVTNLFNYNFNRDIWNDIRVRQAIMYGVDREAILRDVFNGTAIAAPCHDPFPAYWPEDANYYPYDPAMASELLAAAEADGVDVTAAYEIPTYYTSQQAKDILTVIQANLADVGFNVVPTFLDVLAWRQVVNNDADFDIAYRGNGAGALAYELDPNYTEGNQWGINDPEYDRLIAEMNDAFELEDYIAARTALCKYQNEQATFGYWWVSTRYGVASADLENFYFFPAPGGGPVVDNAHLWSVAE